MYRPPVVVVLGHVDHGKTTLLDYIRKSRLAAKEAGQITQSIGGYEAKVDVKGYNTDKLTFIDTPGHEAFSKLRIRGASIADIAILIVDATASVKPQTIESIMHIKQAGMPYIVALNKIDMPTANIDKVKSDLSKAEVYTEGYGGDIPTVEISAMKGTGVDDLLEALLIIASDHNFTYEPDAPLEAYVVETHQEKAGISVSCIIKNGSLKVGDTVFAGDKEAKIRALITDTGARVNEVTPSMPFVLLGFKEIPDVGSVLTTTAGEARQSSVFKKTNAEMFTDFFTPDTSQKLNIVLRADSQGSLEAIIPNLEKNENIQIVLSSVGDVTESDIFLAKVSKAIVIAFATKISKQAELIAQAEKVVVKTYSIIYNLFEELEAVSDLLKEKDERARTFKGEAKVKALFTIEGKSIVGVKVVKGKIDLHDRAELYHNNAVKDEALVLSVKQRAATIESLKKGEEGGLLLDPQLDVKVGDVIKSYSI